MALLSIDKVTKTYSMGARPVRAADAVSIEVEAGAIVALRGPSGSGKTTVLLCAGGLLAPDSGSVTVGNESLYSLPAKRRCECRARTIGFVFQQFNLIPYLTAYENVTLPGLALGKAGAHGSTGDELLERFGLACRRSHLPHALSTGERQRVALARALYNDPLLLCADEPTGNLDDENAESVLGHIRAFANRGGAVLLVTHDARAASFADSTYLIDSGRIKQGRLTTKECS
jgi:putative ABC transport system ATP-binding protein